MWAKLLPVEKFSSQRTNAGWNSVFWEKNLPQHSKTLSFDFFLNCVGKVDHTNCSLSFNEFLTLMSTQQEAEPNHETLVDVFA